MDSAVSRLLDRVWLRGLLLRSEDGVRRKENGGFTLTLRQHANITYSQVMEIIDAATTGGADAHVKFEAVGSRMVISVEDAYPPASWARREARINLNDAYVKVLDVDLDEDEPARPKVIWHNELCALKAFDARSALTVDATLGRFKITDATVFASVKKSD